MLIEIAMLALSASGKTITFRVAHRSIGTPRTGSAIHSAGKTIETF
jgi:hypothetical protein